MGISSTGSQGSFYNNQVRSLWAEIQTLRARVTELEAFVRNVADNYDCDEDSHQMGVGRCRACDAEAILK